ncbi:SGNH/GDSL hydrolase family protein [Paenibacillus turpanensis]|uniref:SGNH/GDSL hydrolase family protein n=1 Tax=Paenibacillus turpanensis TaxID=2689078 RepID=UPI00140E7146|nr:SGNH/GDSL hydrolase family protein [Paenibacillus turpanensis]
MIFDHRDKLLMIGDSITDCERKRPYGEGIHGGVGKGYVAMVDALLTSAYPELSIHVTNMGISGNTVRDLKGRWETDVLELSPDWVSVMIGTNDVWRQHDQPTMKKSHVYLDEYERTLDELVERTLPKVKGMILMTPFYIEPNPQDTMRAMMDQYGDVVRGIAEKRECIFVDTQRAFEPLLRERHSSMIAWDRVHPNPTGHMVLARAFLQAVGFDWQKGQ